MANIFDYVKNNLDTFQERPFCAVDSLALSFAAYMRVPDCLDQVFGWEGMRFIELYRAELFDQYYAGLWAARSGVELLKAMTASPRYRDVRVMGFKEIIDRELQMQFSAITFGLPDGSTYVAFKGTDATFVGWKEDFNLSFQYPVPSQVEAVDYLTEVAEHCPGPLRVGGHSKGGNLAVFAAACVEAGIQGRVEQVYSHDGPGFQDEFMQSSEYRLVAGRVHKTIPESSIVGMLMEAGEYVVVKSDAHGILQHDPSTWVIEGCDFVYAEKISKNARFADETIGQWYRSCTPEAREAFVDALYSLLKGTTGDTMGDFRADWKSNIPAVAKALADMDVDTRASVVAMIGEFLSIGAKNFPELFGVHDVSALKSAKALLLGKNRNRIGDVRANAVG